MYENISVKKEKGSIVIITGEIPTATIARLREHALEHFVKEAKLPGFRPGRAPKEMVLQRVDEMALLEEASKEALSELYPKLIEEHKLIPLGEPRIAITKLAPGNPVGFSIVVTVKPDIALPDYKKLAMKQEKVPETFEVTDKEFDDALTQLRKSKATKAKTSAEDGGSPDASASREGDKEILPEITDEFVKALGPFASVDEFKKMLREDLVKDKRRRAIESRRSAIMEAIVAGSSFDTPELLVESELGKLLLQFRDDVERFGGKFDDYLAHIKKSEDDLRKEWRPDAEKRARLQLILHEIAIRENLLPSPEEIAGEAKHLLEHHKGADENRVRAYVANALTNQKAIEFLESQK